MLKNNKSIFDLVIAPDQVHPSFEKIRTFTGSAPARWMMDQAYSTFIDPDGNFLEQLQSTGFDSRFFELYLHAYFAFSGFEIDRTHDAPDFIVSRAGITAAVEVTTVNAPTSGILAELGKKIDELSPAEMQEYLRHELPMRFGSPLFSKLKRRYWELEHCRGLPVVLAIEAFHDTDSLGFTDAALSGYLYGIAETATWDVDGNLKIQFERMYEHVVGEKKIPSSFFDQPDAENISAVVFTNSGTSSKFGRMGFQFGIGNDTIEMFRAGYCFNEAESARDPTLFQYNLNAPPLVEPWGQGMVVLHNPRAFHPLPLEFFRHAVQTIFDEGYPRSFFQGWHPYSSKTFIADLGEAKQAIAKFPPRAAYGIGAVAKAEFHSISQWPEPQHLIEEGWFIDESGAFLGVVIFDPSNGDWGGILLSRDQYFNFSAVDSASGFESRNEARQSLQSRMLDFLLKPQRLFMQTPAV
jgi:hypothetical protein